MKVSLIILLFAVYLNNVIAQNSRFLGTDKLQTEQLSTSQLKEKLVKYDFSTLLTCTDNTYVYGFIGKNHQRIRIKFISVTKDSLKPNTYKVYGKSMVKNNIDEFNGNLVISSILKQKVMSYGVDDEYKNKGFKGEFVISGNYTLSENTQQKHSGVFNGIFRTGFYLDKKYLIHYDDIRDYSDGYMNNEFIGKWTNYQGDIIQVCNWGDYRIPNSGNFDLGAGDFSPMTNDTSLGWQSIHDMGVRDKNGKLTAKAKLAKKSEEAKWWQ